MKLSTLTLAIISTVTLGFSSTTIAAQHEHDHITVHYEGKGATQHTAEHNQAIAETLNFADTKAFEQSSKNLVAKFDQATADILRAEFAFISEQTPDSVNPSLYRQAQLNMVPNGLYKVSDGIYQVRGTDLSNLTLIKGKQAGSPTMCCSQRKPQKHLLALHLKTYLKAATCRL